MIPLHKLERLPRSQRLRKSAKMLTEAEFRLVSGRPMGWAEQDYLVKISLMLQADGEFSPEAAAEITAAAAELTGALRSETDSPRLPRRPLNALRHIVNREIGQQIADWDFMNEAGELSREGRAAFSGVRLFLEDIRSPFNVGAIFRTAESFGVERIFVSPLGASPDHPRAVRSAMGCVGLVPWEQVEIGGLSGPIFAMETGGIPIDEFDFPVNGTMIVGSEELGVSPKALAIADASAGRVTIPTYGAKGSLNVSVAFGIVMRTWAERVISGSACYPT